MLYFTNQELASIYHVSARTVRNWIESARTGKSNITLLNKGERYYIGNTAKNIKVMEELALKGKKYRPHRAYRILSPKPEFYKLYTPEQIHDIVSNLEIYHEIPPDYNYFDAAATDWDSYAVRLSKEDNINALNATVNLIDANFSYIDAILKDADNVNIIDIGVGNALPAKNLINHLIEIDKMGRYIALDISASMLEIAKRNVQQWFGDKVQFESRLTNINFDRFTGILTEESIKNQSKKTVNLILLFGGTLGNFRSPQGALRTIHDSMGIDDLLIYGKKLDSASTRRLFDVDAGPGEPTLASIYGFVVNLLNINKTYYELELGYDPIRHERYEQIKFNVALTIKFQFEKGERSVNINKNDTILIWRSKQQSALDIINQFDQSEFYTLHTSQTYNQEYILAISRLKRS